MKKKYIAIILIIIGFLVIIEVIFFQKGIQEKKAQQEALMGTLIKALSNKHFKQGTKITYNSNPPSSGAHYPDPQHAGVYTKTPLDGNLVHSLEHGAIIIWYNPKKLSKEQTKTLTNIFTSIRLQKKIMTPRDTMPTAVALTSWGRLLPLKMLDEKQIRAFFKMNYDKGPEQASI